MAASSFPPPKPYNLFIALVSFLERCCQPSSRSESLIPLQEISDATNNFDDKNLIGRGAFGKVYKGRLWQSGRWVDICARRLDQRHGLGNVEFRTEISMLEKLNHGNLVSFIGFCDEEHEKIIINKREARGSLELYLSGSTLTWMQRVNICLGIAHGLRYLHKSGVIHHNINSSTVLLDHKWESKLSGFELSMENTSNISNDEVILTEICGVLGYVDPEYEKTGGVTYKSDVFAFGVVLFEILCGRKAYIQDHGNKFLAPWARSHYEDKMLKYIVHPNLLEDMDTQSLLLFSRIAYACLNEERAVRPDMDEIVNKLNELLFNLQWKHEHPEQTGVAAQVMPTNFWKKKKLEYLRIPLKDIMKATKNFHNKYLVGHANYFDMYKATLELFDGYSFSAIGWNRTDKVPKRLGDVLIKRFNTTRLLEGGPEFFAEIERFSGCEHRNVDTLLGYCEEGAEMIIIHEYPSKCLGDYFVRREDPQALGNHGDDLPWKRRLEICLGIAHGLHHLHSGTEDKPSVIHGNIKSSNILFANSWEPKITSFRLFMINRQHPKDEDAYDTYWEPKITSFRLGATHNNLYAHDIERCKAYCAPEYFQTGTLTKESDIYSFGVVLFEILCGEFAYNIYDGHFKMFTSPERGSFDEETLQKLVDPKVTKEMDLSKDNNMDSVVIFSNIACQCLAETASKRPKIEYVINEIKKALFVQEDHKISFEDIELATKEFSSENDIGEGGYGKVYKGVLQHANVVAKRLNRSSQQGNHQYLTELKILRKYRHKNLINLVGYCEERQENIIVYEYMSNGSLDKHLMDPILTWTKRLQIGLDVARGLEFLHGGSEAQDVVIHSDIKSANILLGVDWRAKIADFGLSLITTINKETDYVFRYPCGTRAYMDPLYKSSNMLTRESDIYSLGVVLLELLSGRLAYEKVNSQSLIMFSKRCFREHKLGEIVFDGTMVPTHSTDFEKFAQIAFKCIHRVRKKRPTADMVVKDLQSLLIKPSGITSAITKIDENLKEVYRSSVGFASGSKGYDSPNDES